MDKTIIDYVKNYKLDLHNEASVKEALGFISAVRSEGLSNDEAPFYSDIVEIITKIGDLLSVNTDNILSVSDYYYKLLPNNIDSIGKAIEYINEQNDKILSKIDNKLNKIYRNL